MCFINLIGHNICTTIQDTCLTLDLWKVHSGAKENEILVMLSESLTVTQTWISACLSLTETYWPNYALHTWNGKPYVPPFCMNFQTRLKEVLVLFKSLFNNNIFSYLYRKAYRFLYNFGCTPRFHIRLVDPKINAFNR